MLELLPMLHYYFNGCARACSLGIAAQIKKKWENHYRYLQVYGLISMPFDCLQKNTRLCYGRKRV
jgi:hypothetical protein